jgi:hypothetical protein
VIQAFGVKNMRMAQSFANIADARYNSLRDQIKPTWYQDTAQERSSYLNSMNFMIRTTGDPAALTSSVIAALRDIDPRLLATEIRTQSDQIDDSLGSERMFAEVSTFFGALAVSLAGIGLYGTLAYQATRRKRELGIRLALGAQRSGAATVGAHAGAAPGLSGYRHRMTRCGTRQSSAGQHDRGHPLPRKSFRRLLLRGCGTDSHSLRSRSSFAPCQPRGKH